MVVRRLRTFLGPRCQDVFVHLGNVLVLGTAEAHRVHHSTFHADDDEHEGSSDGETLEIELANIELHGVSLLLECLLLEHRYHGHDRNNGENDNQIDHLVQLDVIEFHGLILF
jgi:hypothetical protein